MWNLYIYIYIYGEEPQLLNRSKDFHAKRRARQKGKGTIIKMLESFKLETLEELLIPLGKCKNSKLKENDFTTKIVS